MHRIVSSATPVVFGALVVLHGCGSKGPKTTASLSAGTSSGTTAAQTDAESASGESDSGSRLDSMATGDLPSGCGGNGGIIEFSHVWVANNLENTVSRINAQTLAEEGRYVTHPDPASTGHGNPSRTSVNLSGDVVVANRCSIKEGAAGCSGVTKIAGQIERCVDRNNNSTIETSTGSVALPWWEDECVLWHTPFDAGSNRPVAWTSGTPTPDNACEFANAKVWTATSDNVDLDMAHIYLLDGDDGSIEASVDIPNFGGGELAVYGGAVDSNNDFWFVGGYGWVLGHVDIDTMAVDVVPMPSGPYGVIVDAQDRIWTAGGQVNRYDPVQNVWDSFPCETNSCDTLAQDDDGWIWVTEFDKIYQLNPDTMVVERMIRDTEIPIAQLKGIAFDIEGYMWVVQGQGNLVYKIDPTSPATMQTFTNSSQMYTYSDFTGFGLYNVVNPEG